MLNSAISVGALLVTWATASVTLQDPSDIIPPSEWAADNAIIPDYNVPFISVQPTDLEAANSISGTSKTFDHVELSADTNDTDVVLVADAGYFGASFVDILKTGYSSNLLWSSFYGFNAAVNVANKSTAELDHVNITVHNGGANIYAYGTDTVVNVTNSWLYSSGPVSHGLYASGNGTIYGSNIAHFSGGRRSSSFSGDSPAGFLYVSDSVAHTQGIGSATYYALGTIAADNVVSISENGPVVFMDGAQTANLTNCDATAGLLGGVALFSSATRTSGAELNLKNTRITTTGSTIPGLWFGNTIIDVSLYASELVTQSGVLVVANYSQITQDFDYYADYTDNADLLPAEVYVTVEESSLEGDLLAYNGSLISWSLKDHSSWTGAAYSGYGKAAFDVYLDKTSNWTLTKDTVLQNFTDEDQSLSNVKSGGFTLTYNSTASENGWLGGKTVQLQGGGTCGPLKA